MKKATKRPNSNSVQTTQNVPISTQFKSVKKSWPNHGTMENTNGCKKLKKSTCRSAFGDVTNTLGQSATSSEGTQASLKRTEVLVENPPNTESNTEVEVKTSITTESKTEVEVKTEATESKPVNDDDEAKTSEDTSEEDTTDGSEVRQPLPTPDGIELPTTLYDRFNCGCPNKVPDYACAIFQNDRVLEENLLKDINMDCFHLIQDDYINQDDRTQLVDWMINIAHVHGMKTEALYNTVQMIDRLFSSIPIARCELKLAGGACLYISAKLEEVVVVKPKELVELGELAFSHPQLLWMERRVFAGVGFRVSYPSSYRFLRRFAAITNRASAARLALAHFILELSLCDFRYSRELGSKKAAAALLTAFKIVPPIMPWDNVMEHYTGYKVKDLTTLAIDFNTLLAIADKCGCKATIKKYSDNAHHRISKCVRAIKRGELKKLLEEYSE